MPRTKIGGVHARVNARPIVAAFTHEEVYLLSCAARAYAAVLDVTDGPFPSPEMRDAADTLRDLEGLLNTANAARNFIEEEVQS